MHFLDPSRAGVELARLSLLAKAGGLIALLSGATGSLVYALRPAVGPRKLGDGRRGGIHVERCSPKGPVVFDVIEQNFSKALTLSAEPP